MWKLIKMDLYRLGSGKAIKFAALVSCLVSAGAMAIFLGIVVLCRAAFSQDPSVAIALGEAFPCVGWMAGANLSDIIFTGTGAFSLFVGCMLCASFIGSEQSCGYAKNFAGQLPNRGYMAISKFIVTSIAQVVILLIYVIVSAVCGKLFFNQYITGFDVPGLLSALGLRVMLHIAINAIIFFLCTLTKSHAIAMVAGSIFGLGITHIAYMSIGMVLKIAKINVEIGNYMPDGINVQLTLQSVNELWVKAIVVSVVCTAVFLFADYILLKRRDVK